VTGLSLALLSGAGSVIASAIALGLLRRYQVMDLPNNRSSHAIPTPKGGGVGFILVIAAAIFLLYSRDIGTNVALPVLAAATVALSVIGLIDDLKNLPALSRLVAQCLLAIVITGTVFLPLETAPGLLVVGGMLALLWLVWCTNLYNFMDGIDGIAVTQAILCSGLITAISAFGLYSGDLTTVAAIILGSCLGFALFNLPPAKMFMGDAGSAALGLLFAGCALVDLAAQNSAGWLWPIGLAGFISDATATLAVRFVTGHKVYEAHRSHLYQLYTQHHQQRFLASGMPSEMARARAHRRTLVALVVIFLIWQLPIACTVAIGAIPGWLGAGLAVTTLSLLALALGAGRDRFRGYGTI